MLHTLTFPVAAIFFICYKCYIYMLRWGDGSSDGSDVLALVAPKLITLSEIDRTTAYLRVAVKMEDEVLGEMSGGDFLSVSGRYE